MMKEQEPQKFMKMYRNVSSVMVALCVLSVPAVMAQQGEDDDVLSVNPEADAYDIAESLYMQARQAGVDAQSRRSGLTSAATLFGRFVQDYPKSPNAIKAQFRQAMCLEELGNRAGATAVLEKIAARKGGGEFAATAAYKLATQAAGQNLWEKARNYYLITARETQNAAMRNDANFRLARAHRQLGQKGEAEALFSALADTPGVEAVYAEIALYDLAQMKTEDGKFEDAYKLFTRLLSNPKLDPSRRGTATLQAARLAVKLNRMDEAQNLYAALQGMPGMEKHNAEAQMIKLRNLVQAKDYKAVIATVTGQYMEMNSPENEAKRAVYVGLAYMELGKYEEAARWYEVAEVALPKTHIAADCAYRRLICLRLMRKSEFVLHAKKYLNTYAAPGESTASLPCVDLVRVMYADRLLLAAPQEASRQYEAINFNNLSGLSEKERADIMYKRAWSATKIENNEMQALKVLEDFVNQFPNDVHIPEVLAMRGNCNMRMNNLAAAMADFEKVINEYPNSASAPTCMQKAALASAEAKDTAKMIHFYELLIKSTNRAVKPAAIAEAHYHIARAKAETAPAEAIPHFMEARRINPEGYASVADLCLVQCYYRLEDAANLLEALNTLKTNNIDTYRALPPDIPLWCGWKCFQNKQYLKADEYLSDAVGRSPREKYKDAEGNEKERAAVQPLVWKTLARTRLELRQYESGLEAAEFYVSMEEKPYRKAEGMRDKAQLLIGLHRTEEARKLCEQAIEMGIDGPIKSYTFLTLGDTYYAERNFAEAAKYYGRTANVVSDKDLQPLGLYKVAYALRHDNRAGEAAQYEDALKKEFPNWLPEPNTGIFMKMHDKQ